MELAELQRHWEAFGSTDPFWAVLTDETRRYGGWEKHLDNFFASGQIFVAGLLEDIGAQGFTNRRRALDFGCGVGRLTQGLGDHFEQSVGVDIAPSMLRVAEDHNRHGGRCQYQLNASDDLSAFPDAHFDFILSHITLQHIRPDYAKRYIAEFLRVLAPGGVAVFQMPSEVLPPEINLVPGQVAVQIDPLAKSAYRARIEFLDPPTSMKASARVEIRVRVTNLGDAPWPAGSGAGQLGEVRLGNHWRALSGMIRVTTSLLQLDDARTALPGDLAPGESVDLGLNILPPPKAGRHVLELDMVQEGHAWFADRGSETARIDVRVWRPLTLKTWRADTPSPKFKPVMETHGVCREEILGIVAKGGGRAIDVREGFWNCEGWKGFQYFIAKCGS